MKLTVKRQIFTPISTGGELFIDSAHECYTLEPPVKTDGSKPRAIPERTYKVTIRHSPRFGRDMIHVENVPDFEGILIHVLNFPHETEGCLGVGQSRGNNLIRKSRPAYEPVFAKVQDALRKGESVSITYETEHPSSNEE
jgi:hypothetical protein